MLSFGLSIALRTHSSSVSVVIPKFITEMDSPMLCVCPMHFLSLALQAAAGSSPQAPPSPSSDAPPSLQHQRCLVALPGCAGGACVAHWLPLTVTGLSAPVPRGRKGKKTKNQMLLPEIKNADWLATCNPEVVLHDDSYKKHLKQHCNK